MKNYRSLSPQVFNIFMCLGIHISRLNVPGDSIYSLPICDFGTFWKSMFAFHDILYINDLEGKNSPKVIFESIAHNFFSYKTC